MYRLNRSVVYDENGKKHNTYGISYKEREVKDISTDKHKIEKLVNLCNELELSPIHLDDVIEDFLVDFEI